MSSSRRHRQQRDKIADNGVLEGTEGVLIVGKRVEDAPLSVGHQPSRGCPQRARPVAIAPDGGEAKSTQVSGRSFGAAGVSGVHRHDGGAVGLMCVCVIVSLISWTAKEGALSGRGRDR